MTWKKSNIVHPLNNVPVTRALQYLYNGEVLLRFEHEARPDHPIYLGGSVHIGAELSDDVKRLMGRTMFLKEYRNRFGDMIPVKNGRIYHHRQTHRTEQKISDDIVNTALTTVTTIWRPTGYPPSSLLREINDTERQLRLMKVIQSNICKGN